MVTENALEFERAQRAARRVMACRKMSSETKECSPILMQLALRAAADHENIVIMYANHALGNTARSPNQMLP